MKGLKEHYSDSWSILNSTFLTLSTVAVCIWASIIYTQFTKIQPLELSELHDVTKSEIFFVIAFRMTVYIYICGVNFVLLFVKFLRYLVTWFERSMIIFETLARAYSDIFYFLIMFLVIFFAFVIMSHIYYGANLTTFGSVPMATRTLFLMLMGNMSYLDDMIALNKTLSFFFFVFFITSMQFILLNMIIAFISKSYSEANVETQTTKTIEDELGVRHWSVVLMETKDRLSCCWCCKARRKGGLK